MMINIGSEGDGGTLKDLSDAKKKKISVYLSAMHCDKNRRQRPHELFIAKMIESVLR